MSSPSQTTTGDFARMDRANDRAYDEMLRTGGDFARADGAGYRSAPYVPPSYAMGEMGSGTLGVNDNASIPAFAGAPRPAPSPDLFRQSERDYRQATDTGAVIRPGDTLERLTGGNKELMGRYARGMGLKDMNQLRVGQSMRADWGMGASEALGTANAFYAADGQRKLAAAAQAATTANRVGMSYESGALTNPGAVTSLSAIDQIPTGGNGRGPTPRPEPSGYFAQAADWLDRAQTTEVGKLLQGWPLEGIAVGGLKAGLGVLGKAESIATRLQAAERVGTAKEAVDGLGFTRSQLQHAFKHAKDFGLTENANNKMLSEFSSVLQSHVDAAGTLAIQGTYRGNPVTHHVDPSTGLNVIRDSSGNFLSGWKLSPPQLQHVLTTGKLGGG